MSEPHASSDHKTPDETNDNNDSNKDSPEQEALLAAQTDTNSSNQNNSDRSPELKTPVTPEPYDPLDDIPVPPDGGWGWVVVLSSFLIHVFADGIVYSFGIFYVEFLDYYKGGKGETAWVGSLLPGITLATGPVASILTNKYGCRAVTIAGSLIAALGFLISLFSPSLYMLYFTFGIMGGFGFGLIYLPAIVSVGFYFEKRRAFATGIAVCGSGFGTFIFAPLSNLLVQEYGWKGAVLILTGFILNCAVCGALFRPLYSPKELREIKEKRIEKRKKKHGGKDIQNGDTPSKTPLIKSSQSDPVQNIRSVSPTAVRSDGAVNQDRPRLSHSSHHLEAHGAMARKDIFYSGSLMNIPMYRSNRSLYVASVASLPQTVASVTEPKTLGQEIKAALREMMDFSLLKDLTFVMFVISNFFTSIGFNAPFIYIPDRAKLEGVEDDPAAFLLSIVGIANTIGRVVFGILGDMKWVNRLYLYNVALTICGVGTVLSVFCKIYPLMALYAGVFGCFIGAYVGLTSVILVDLLGLDKLTSSFGLLLLFQGVATLIGPPIVGWIYDATQSFDVGFYVTGTMVAISGLMLFFIPCVRRWEDRKKGGASEHDIQMGKRTDKVEEIEMEPVAV